MRIHRNSEGRQPKPTPVRNVAKAYFYSLIALIATPIHPASYTTLMTIPAADVGTPIVTVPPIAIIPIGTAIAVVTIRAIAMAVIPIGTAIAIAVVAVRAAAVISTAICTSLNSAMDTSNAAGR